MIIRSAIIVFFISILPLTVFSQNTYKDTIFLEQIVIEKSIGKKPKIKKVKFGQQSKKEKVFFVDYKHKYNQYYLVQNFPYGKIQDISLYFNNLNQINTFDGVKRKNIIFCDKENHKVEIYEAVDLSGSYLIGEKVYENIFLLPITKKSSSLSSINIDLSHLNMTCGSFFIKIIPPTNTLNKQNCQRQTYGFLAYKDSEALFYGYNQDGNLSKGEGFGLEMDLKVLTREY